MKCWKTRALKLLLPAVLYGCFSVAVQAANLTIEVNKGKNSPTPIAVVPFAWKGAGFSGEQLADIVSSDLYRSGQFMPQDAKKMLSSPHMGSEVVYRDWRMSGAQYLVVGSLQSGANGDLTADFTLLNINGEKVMFSKSVTGGANDLRDIAHYISDEVYEALTGFRGAFSTRIVYVRAEGGIGREMSHLVLADQDGARDRVLFSSKQPILSPDWSPDGKEVVYVSFENNRHPAIFRQVLATGQREQLTNFKGLNSAPSYSPDGRRLAMCLSKDGNQDIYVMDLATRQLERITKTLSINTEPSWTPDGRAIIFTSDRGGKPQLYKVSLAGGQVERLTFEGDFNAHGRMSRDGKLLVFAHRVKGVFHTAVQDVKTGRITVLTQAGRDESPAVAPNSRLLMYATEDGGRGVLASVSVDGGVQVRLPSSQGNMREPAWGPFKPR